jgi:uncharacterized RDD family membrane protein YckC
MDQPHAPVYAGFWMRFLAYIIDTFLLGLVNFIIFIPVMGIVGITAASGAAYQDLDSGTAGLIVAMMGTMFLSIIAVMIVGWLYFALMESSAKQGTLGKMALSLQVTDLEGRRLTFGRATGRYFGKIVSSAIMGIGYIMAGFTQQKQALHDIMAGCLVVRK